MKEKRIVYKETFVKKSTDQLIDKFLKRKKNIFIFGHIFNLV